MPNPFALVAPRTYAVTFTPVFRCVTVFAKWVSALRPFSSLVKRAVFRGIREPKIFNAIVFLISVNMVDVFYRLQLPAKAGFYDQAMLKNIGSVVSDEIVTSGMNYATAFPGWVCGSDRLSSLNRCALHGTARLRCPFKTAPNHTKAAPANLTDHTCLISRCVNHVSPIAPATVCISRLKCIPGNRYGVSAFTNTRPASSVQFFASIANHA